VLGGSYDRSQTAGLVIRPFQVVAEDLYRWSVGPKHGVKSLI